MQNVPAGAIDLQTSPDRYHHWDLRVDGRVAWLGLDVDEEVQAEAREMEALQESVGSADD